MTGDNMPTGILRKKPRYADSEWISKDSLVEDKPSTIKRVSFHKQLIQGRSVKVKRKEDQEVLTLDDIMKNASSPNKSIIQKEHRSSPYKKGNENIEEYKNSDINRKVDSPKSGDYKSGSGGGMEIESEGDPVVEAEPLDLNKVEDTAEEKAEKLKEKTRMEIEEGLIHKNHAFIDKEELVVKEEKELIDDENILIESNGKKYSMMDIITQVENTEQTTRGEAQGLMNILDKVIKREEDSTLLKCKEILLSIQNKILDAIEDLKGILLLKRRELEKEFYELLKSKNRHEKMKINLLKEKPENAKETLATLKKLENQIAMIEERKELVLKKKAVFNQKIIERNGDLKEQTFTLIKTCQKIRSRVEDIILKIKKAKDGKKEKEILPEEKLVDLCVLLINDEFQREHELKWDEIIRQTIAQIQEKNSNTKVRVSIVAYTDDKIYQSYKVFHFTTDISKVDKFMEDLVYTDVHYSREGMTMALGKVLELDWLAPNRLLVHCFPIRATRYFDSRWDNLVGDIKLQELFQKMNYMQINYLQPIHYDCAKDNFKYMYEAYLQANRSKSMHFIKRELIVDEPDTMQNIIVESLQLVLNTNQVKQSPIKPKLQGLPDYITPTKNKPDDSPIKIENSSAKVPSIKNYPISSNVDKINIHI